MASNVPVSDTESSAGSSSIGENDNTIHNPHASPSSFPPPHRASPPCPCPFLPPPPPRTTSTFRCLNCSRTFPTSDAMLAHRREKKAFHSPPVSCNMNKTIVNPVRGNGPQPIMPPQPPPPPTIVVPQQPRANQITSRLEPSPSSIRHNNTSGNGTRGSGFLRYHPYLRQEIMPIGSMPHIGTVDHGSSPPPPPPPSPENRTLDLISQLDPTRDFLSQLERHLSGQRGNGANVAPNAERNATLGRSKGKGVVDVNLKL